jgi:signal transduction histidine kinase
MECRFVTKTGETRRAALFIAPITQRRVPAILINLVDITERELLKKQIRLDTERRQGLISTVASELSTPLQPIIGYLNMLIEDPEAHGVTEETRGILDRVAKSVDHERQIISQMLELSVLDEGKISLEYSAFPVPELIRSLVEAGDYSVKAEIALDIPRDLVFEADKNKISVVIDALLSNAVAYSKPSRKIRVMYRSTAGDTMHRLAIQDNGVGITSARLDEIFKPSEGMDAGSIARKREQVGLSLSIARKYVQMHGGYISVDSIVNFGSTFTVHIPKQKPAEETE